MVCQANRAAAALQKKLEAAVAEAERIAADLRMALDREKVEAERLRLLLDEAEEEAMRQATAANGATAAMHEVCKAPHTRMHAQI